MGRQRASGVPELLRRVRWGNLASLVLFVISLVLIATWRHGGDRKREPAEPIRGRVEVDRGAEKRVGTRGGRLKRDRAKSDRAERKARKARKERKERKLQKRTERRRARTLRSRMPVAAPVVAPAPAAAPQGDRQAVAPQPVPQGAAPPPPRSGEFTPDPGPRENP